MHWYQHPCGYHYLDLLHPALTLYAWIQGCKSYLNSVVSNFKQPRSADDHLFVVGTKCQSACCCTLDLCAVVAHFGSCLHGVSVLHPLHCCLLSPPHDMLVLLWLLFCTLLHRSLYDRVRKSCCLQLMKMTGCVWQSGFIYGSITCVRLASVCCMCALVVSLLLSN